jgi:hypothetical protein
MSLYWSPEVELSEEEHWLLSHCKKAKLFVFLRQHRHRLFTDDFQRELAGMYSDRKAGKAPVPPALLAMVTILQAAMRVSDEDAVELAVVERRWQMLLGCLGHRKAPFSQGALFNFRQRLIAHDLDRRLLERTVELARDSGGYSHKALRAAFDASPLFGAGRVEDTFNLIGHAMREVLRTIAARLGVGMEEAARQAKVPLLTGSSLKASLDIDWDDPAQRKDALARLLEQVRSLSAFLESELAQEIEQPPLREQWATLQQILAQDLEPDPRGGGMQVKRGVAKDRRISIRDAQMRHGRKSKSTRIDGFKRHLALDVDTHLILAAAITPANRPEGEAAGGLLRDVKQQGFAVSDLHIDRGYLAAPEVEAARAAGTAVHCKAFPLHNRGRFTKAEFILELQSQRIICPAGQSISFLAGSTSRFPASVCNACPLRERCTASVHGRSISVHPQEAFFVELRSKQRTSQGRAELRKRIPVEHGLAAISRTQGRRARYVGARKNLFDLRRHAAVSNLFVAARAA